MAKQKNIRIDQEKLDKVIKAIEGDKYSPKRISKFVLGKSDSYYSKSVLTNGNISKDTLDRLCEYYDLKAEDFLQPSEVTLVPPATGVAAAVLDVPYVSGIDGETLFTMLGDINKALVELVALQKATNSMLGDLLDKSDSIARTNKKVAEIAETSDKGRKPPYKNHRS